MFYKYAAAFAVMLALASLSIEAYAQEKPVLTLGAAIAEALARSPVLAASRDQEKAAHAAQRQSGLLPNPQIGITAENALGNGPYNGFDNAEITYGVTQLIELPGKRGNRIAIASREHAISAETAKSARLDVIQSVQTAYAEASIAREMVTLAENELNVAKEVHGSVAAKVDAGKEPPLQAQKAKIAYTNSQLGYDRAERALKAAEGQLQSLLGRGNPNYTLDPGFLGVIAAPLSQAEYEQHLLETPEAVTAAENVSRAEAEVRLEKARRLPDPTINLGMRDFRGTGDQAVVLGVSLPIPVFDLNSATVEKAGSLLNSAKQEMLAQQEGKQITFAAAYSAFVDAYHAAVMLDRDILPNAAEAASLAHQSYAAGKLGYLEVLDAQRTLFDAQKERLSALLEYHRQKALVERLTGYHQATAIEKDSTHEKK